jgi:hypothetical protein
VSVLDELERVSDAEALADKAAVLQQLRVRVLHQK